jgi:hypothetical protein
MSELSDLVKNIERVKEDADVNLHNADFRTLPSLELKRNQAKRDLVELTTQYKNLISKRMAKIFLTGVKTENVGKFVDLLKKEKLTVFQAPSVYENIAQTVWPNLSSGNLYSTPAFLRLCETCRILSDHFVTFPKVPPKNIGTDTIVKNMAELTVLVKTAVRFAYGDSLTKAYINEQVYKEALNTRFNDRLMCLVIADVTPEERNALAEVLFPDSPVFNVDLENEEPSRSHALRLYRKIFESFKGLEPVENKQ